MTGPIDDFIASCTPTDRQVLGAMVDLAHDVVPGLVQTTSYRLPALSLGPTSRQVVCGFAVGRRFLSWYPSSSATITTLAHELSGVETSG
ncbi:hypothetical protein GCM10027030_20670 [Luteococcus sediminum]